MKTITFSHYPELIKPSLKMKDVKKIIKEKTGIIEQNQRFEVIFYSFVNFSFFEEDNQELFWDRLALKIYDKTKYSTKLSLYNYEANIILDLNKKVEELKQMVFEQTKIPMDRQQFLLNDEKLNNDSILNDENLFEKKLTITIPEKLNDVVYIKYPNSSIKEIKTDLFFTGIKFLEQLEIESKDAQSQSDFKNNYNIYCKDNKLILHDILYIQGIRVGDTLELRKGNNVVIYVKPLMGKELTFSVDPSDTIISVKILVEKIEGTHHTKQNLIFDNKFLEDNRTISDYNIQNGDYLYLIEKLKMKRKNNDD